MTSLWPETDGARRRLPKEVRGLTFSQCYVLFQDGLSPLYQMGSVICTGWVQSLYQVDRVHCTRWVEYFAQDGRDFLVLDGLSPLY